MTEGDLTERMFRALCIQLIRAGKMDQADILAAADDLDRDGDDEAAHALRCIPVEAAAPSSADWEADRRRARMRLVKDGGDRQG